MWKIEIDADKNTLNQAKINKPPCITCKGQNLKYKLYLRVMKTY